MSFQEQYQRSSIAARPLSMLPSSKRQKEFYNNNVRCCYAISSSQSQMLIEQEWQTTNRQQKNELILRLDCIARMNNLGVSSLESSLYENNNNHYEQAGNYFRRALDKATEYATTATIYHPRIGNDDGDCMPPGASRTSSRSVRSDNTIYQKVRNQTYIVDKTTTLTSNQDVVPSRISILGKHNDYDEGLYTYSIPLLIDTNHATIHIATASILFNLGLLYIWMNENEKASIILLRCLQMTKLIHRDEPNYSIIAILHNIGLVQYRMGCFTEAICTYSEALNIGTEKFHCGPTDMLHVASALTCLGVVYFHLPKSESDMAMNFYLESLEIHHKIFGVEYQSKEIATILNNLGRAMYLKGEYKDALELFQRCIQMRRNLLGNDHIDVAASIFNAGQTYHQLHYLDEAMILYKEFLNTSAKHIKTYRGDVAIVIRCLAQLYHEKKEYDKAAKLYEEAVFAGKAAFGNYHPEVMFTLNKLGNLFYEKGDFESAINVYRKVLEIEQTVLDVFHPNVVVTLTNIGRIHELRGEYQAALYLFNKAATIQRHTLGPSHPNIAATLSLIASIHYQSRNFPQALDVYQEALLIRRDVFGENHLDVASNLNAIGLVLFKLGVHDIALQSFSESLRIRRLILGSDHQEVAIVFFNIATIHLETGDDDKALVYYHKALRVEKIALGHNHYDLVLTVQHIGQVHQKRGELVDALKFFNEALEIQHYHRDRLLQSSPVNYEKVLDNYLATAQTFNLIGNVYLQQGDAHLCVIAFSEALRLIQRAGKNDDELVISGFNFYSLSKLHPPCSPCA